MSSKLTLSTMVHSFEVENDIQYILSVFCKQRGIKITYKKFNYTTGWSDFQRMSIYGGRPDISEIGTTWINHIASRNVIRPFSVDELHNIIDSKAFIPAIWKSSMSSDVVWAIPWLTDIRFVCFRRDLLSKARVDEENAFDTPEHFQNTLQMLHDNNTPIPWVVYTNRTYMNVHNLAMWVWQAGEELVDFQNKVLLLDRPRVRSAILSFFELHKFIPDEYKHLTDTEIDELFINGRVAVHITGPWSIIHSLQNPMIANKIGIAIPLGCSYIGGSSLVVWKNNDKLSPEIIKLLAHLTSLEFQKTFPKIVGLFPGRLDAIEEFPLSTSSFYPTILQAVKCGKSLPNFGLWGLIEDRLSEEVAKLWRDILNHPNDDIGEKYDNHIIPMVKHLNNTLSRS
jgi:ABC-type glycerol-3-phosphate transport system substrate-binding protein